MNYNANTTHRFTTTYNATGRKLCMSTVVEELNSPASSITAENAFLNDVCNNLVNEAIRHFNANHCRRRDEDARYFYKYDEVVAVMRGVTTVGRVKVNEILDDSGKIFCWELTPVYTACETRKPYKKKSVDNI